MELGAQERVAGREGEEEIEGGEEKKNTIGQESRKHGCEGWQIGVKNSTNETQDFR